MKLLLTKLQARIIHIALVLVLVLLGLYLSSCGFRQFLEDQNIDPNFLIGFFTVTALLLSLIQSSKDKRYSYNLKLIDSIEDKGLKVIGKLLGVRGKSLVVLSSARHCIKAKKDRMIFKDLNNSLSKEDVESDIELITAYVDTYFPEQKTDWNRLIENLTEISNIAGNILVNYQENLKVINEPNFRNDALDNADSVLNKASKIHEEIEALTLKIRDGIATKINESKKKLKNSFDFSL
ncbi:MAG: hypothetical protein Q7R64_02805 [bacterium]|nr:hypothetical protein [bacterium]